MFLKPTGSFNHEVLMADGHKTRMMTTVRLLVWLLPFAGIVCLYYTLFCAWNTAFQPAIYVIAWRALAYKWATLGVLIGIIWVFSTVRLFREKRRGSSIA